MLDAGFFTSALFSAVFVFVCLPFPPLFFCVSFLRPFAKYVALMSSDSLCLSRSHIGSFRGPAVSACVHYVSRSFNALFLRVCAAQRVCRFLVTTPPRYYSCSAVCMLKLHGHFLPIFRSIYGLGLLPTRHLVAFSSHSCNLTPCPAL